MKYSFISALLISAYIIPSVAGIDYKILNGGNNNRTHYQYCDFIKNENDCVRAAVDFIGEDNVKRDWNGNVKVNPGSLYAGTHVSPPYCFVRSGDIYYDDGRNYGKCASSYTCLCWDRKNYDYQAYMESRKEKYEDSAYYIEKSDEKYCEKVRSQNECSWASEWILRNGGHGYSYGSEWKYQDIVALDWDYYAYTHNQNTPAHRSLWAQGCYFYRKYNLRYSYSNTGSCSYNHPCICRTPQPTPSPTDRPTQIPVSSQPTVTPTHIPSPVPTTSNPTPIPTTSSPTPIPTTSNPSPIPSQFPSGSPSQPPSYSPSTSPTSRPTDSPVTGMPTVSPSRFPSNNPSKSPSDVPSALPSTSPSDVPSALPSASPSDVPSALPSANPTEAPQTNPPTSNPTTRPTSNPTISKPIVNSTESNKVSGVKKSKEKVEDAESSATSFLVTAVILILFFY